MKITPMKACPVHWSQVTPYQQDFMIHQKFTSQFTIHYVISENITPHISRVMNSFDFNTKVKNTITPHGYKIISSDAVSLITNFHIGIAIKGIKDRWPQIQTHVKMPWYQFEKCIRT